MEIPIPGKTIFILEQGPGAFVTVMLQSLSVQ